MENSRKSNISLGVGVAAIGLSLFSALAVGAPDEPPAVKLTDKEMSLFQQVLNPSGGEPSARCKDSVAMMKEQGDKRSEESLMSTCLALPSDHAHICGIPEAVGSYFIVENDRCLQMEGGIQLHAQARKIPTRDTPAWNNYEEWPNANPGSDGDGGGTGSGAQ